MDVLSANDTLPLEGGRTVFLRSGEIWNRIAGPWSNPLFLRGSARDLSLSTRCYCPLQGSSSRLNPCLWEALNGSEGWDTKKMLLQLLSGDDLINAWFMLAAMTPLGPTIKAVPVSTTRAFTAYNNRRTFKWGPSFRHPFLYDYWYLNHLPAHFSF